MIDVYIVHNDPSVERKVLDTLCKTNFFLHFIDEGSLKGKKEAFKLKGTWGARKTPFVAVFSNGNIIKAFYSEADDDVIKSLFIYLNDL